MRIPSLLVRGQSAGWRRRRDPAPCARHDHARRRRDGQRRRRFGWAGVPCQRARYQWSRRRFRRRDLRAGGGDHGVGRLLAQGGGGGGASNFNAGVSGGDGMPSGIAIQGGPGGIGGGTGAAGETNHGGLGGFRNAGRPSLANLSGANYGNGGGGGGGVGRIVIRATSIVGAQTSPQAAETP